MADRSEYNKEYYKKHKDTANKRSRDWYEKNKEKCKDLSRKNYEENKERARKSAKEWAKANPEKVQAQNKRWAERHPEKFAEIRLRQELARNNWTLERYQISLKEQKGLCSICKEKPKKRRLSADHDHTTGSPRELLCERCNLMLGRVEDAPRILETAAAYLRKWGKI